ncbi:MAG: LLM class F420-dependent oxidoreductase [Acidimicrobiaceae bacterium]|nr:LLM class F420-dependent oxidoreductase [Acidimicrobiaceae bacterium]|tara:strand:- start:325 stop:1164 length:840 start_codon:yes stop_codon:yes gene_type:complete
MEIGIKVAPHHVEWDTLLAVSEIADQAEVFHQFWNFDHFYPIKGDTDGPCLEAWITLTAIAQATKRIRIGCMVNGVHYRHPAVLANMASALDIVSQGRFELGLGAGWNELESGAYGIELGSLKERFDRFDEALEVITSLLAEEYTSFSGEYFTLIDARNEPKGPQQPLPICIGGTGEKRTLRSVAHYASHWNLPMCEDQLFEQKYEVLKKHCEKAGTNIDDIKISTHVFVEEETTASSVISEIQHQRQLGIHQSILYFQPPIHMKQIELLADSLMLEFC